MTYKHVIFASYGNDSVALIQWAHERGLSDVATLYNNTGWAAACWTPRVLLCEEWVRSLGFTPHQTTSEGMEALVHKKRGWPRQGMQFCTEQLKIEPTKRWLAASDPDKDAICLVGVRREESVARREFPEWTEETPSYDGRSLWAPLVNVQTAERNALIIRAGFQPLPHRSKECDPCVNANKTDIQNLDEPDLAKVERIEGDLGNTHTPASLA